MRAVMVAFVLFLLGVAFSASFGLENALYNGGFEEGDLNGWNYYAGEELTVATSYNGLNPVEGEYLAYWAGVEGNNGQPMARIWQTFFVEEGGWYDADLSGWVYVGEGLPERAYSILHLIVNEEIVASTGRFYNTGGDWQYFELIQEGMYVEPNSTVSVYFMFFNLDNGVFAECAVDGLDLEGRPIPEPGTIALLLSGLAGIAGFIRRKH